MILILDSYGYWKRGEDAVVRPSAVLGLDRKAAIGANAGRGRLPAQFRSSNRSV